MEETYYGGTLPEIVVNGSAWKYRQAVKRNKGKQVADAVRNGRDRLAGEISGYLPITGDIRFISNLIGNIKDGNAMSSLPWLLVAALPGIAKKAARPLARKLLKNAKETGYSLFNESIEYPNITRTYSGSDYHYQRLKDGTYKRVNIDNFPEKEINGFYKPYNIENPDEVSKFKNDYGLTDDHLRDMQTMKMLDAPIGNSGFRTRTDPNVRSFTFYHGNKVKDQREFDYSLPHEVHHAVSTLGTFNHGLTRARPPINTGIVKNKLRKQGVNEFEIDGIISEWDNEYNNWDEFAARGTQLLDYFKIKDAKTKLTGNQVKYASRHYVKDTGINNQMDQFFDLMDGKWQQVAEWFNKHCTAIGALIAMPYQSNSK